MTSGKASFPDVSFQPMDENPREELEDTREDVLRKAYSMAGITEGIASRPLPSSPITRDDFLLHTLHLDPSAFQSMTNAVPSISLPSGLVRHVLPFGDWTLNIWTIETPKGLIAVDTGLSPDQLQTATSHTSPVAILITHIHRDHIGGISAYPNAPIYSPTDSRPETSLSIAGLDWKILDLAGHTPDGIGWFTEYQGQKIFFPGDSIFARSIGKCQETERLAMSNILNVMSELPGDTIICPGHGPATTVADEWKFNPFIAPFNRK